MVYRPFCKDNPDDEILVLALEKNPVDASENDNVRNHISRDFYIYDGYRLDGDLKEFLSTHTL